MEHLTLPHFFLHLGNVLYLCAYSVRDILWLRILMVVAMFSLLPYYYCCSTTPLYEAIIWQSIFITVNLIQIALLILERRPVFLGEEEMRLYRTVFSSLAPREFVKLVGIAEWKHAKEGDILLRQDEKVSQLALISTGRAGVELDGRHIAEVGPSQFVGEMGFLTEEPASANVVARLPMDYLCWPVPTLREFLRDNPQIHVKVQGILGTDLVEKLRREGFSAAHPSKIMNMYQKGELE